MKALITRNLMLASALLMPGSQLYAQDKTTPVNQPETQAYQPVDDPELQTRVDQVIRGFYKYRNEKYAEYEKLKSRQEQLRVYEVINGQELKVCRELVDIGLENPKSKAAQTAWSWVIEKPGLSDAGLYGIEFRRAAMLLVHYHSDSAYVASQTFWMKYNASPGRDLFIYGLNAAARNKEAIGLAKLGLAMYLQTKSTWVASNRQKPESPTIRSLLPYEKSALVTTIDTESDSSFAYSLQLQSIDPALLKSLSMKLFDEIIEQYSDIRCVSSQFRDVEAALKQNEPELQGKKLAPEAINELNDQVSKGKKRTLGQVALDQLDEILNLSVGKPAPEIVAESVDGKKFKLSDYRGKAVLLVFWGTWCGPCMAEVPHERALVEKFKDKPFAIIGVNCDENRQKALEVIQTEKMNWPNFYDGEPGTGPIADKYHIRKYPTTLLLDEKGVIQAKDLARNSLEGAIDKLLDKIEATNSTKENSRSLPKPGS